MARSEKVAAVAELTERFQTSAGAVLTEYRGLSVAQLAELRRSLGENATFSVVKNTLTKIAATEAGVADELSDILSGPSAIAFVRGDVVEAAKGLRDFSRANPFLVIKGGVLDGRKLTPAEIAQLAELESREVLLARLAGALKASLSGAAATFAALPAGMARLIAALQDKRSGEAPAEPEAETRSANAGPAEAGPAAADAAVPSGPAEQAAADEAAQGDGAEAAHDDGAEAAHDDGAEAAHDHGAEAAQDHGAEAARETAGDGAQDPEPGGAG